jgi:hypothetical protein
MITLLLLALATSTPQAYDFAEDVPPGAGYSVVLRLVADESGRVTECAADGVFELTPEAPQVELEPSSTYVSEACRKLATRTWKPGPKFYFCRYLSEQPDKAFCESRFGR